jgi:hypothetical protein
MVTNASIPYLSLSKFQVSNPAKMQSEFQCRSHILFRTSTPVLNLLKVNTYKILDTIEHGRFTTYQCTPRRWHCNNTRRPPDHHKVYPHIHPRLSILRLRSRKRRTILSIPDFPNRISILSQTDHAILLNLAAVTQDVFHKVKKHQRSLVTARQIKLLKTHIIQPSHELRVTPEYVMDLLLYYLEHKGAEGKRHLAGHFYGTRLPLFRSLPVFVWCMRSQSCITTRLISRRTKRRDYYWGTRWRGLQRSTPGTWR